MRMLTRKGPDQTQLTFDWDAAAVTAKAAIVESTTTAEEVLDGHGRRDCAGGPPLLHGEAESPRDPAPGGLVDAPGERRAHRAFAGGNGSSHAGAGRPSD